MTSTQFTQKKSVLYHHGHFFLNVLYPLDAELRTLEKVSAIRKQYRTILPPNGQQLPLPIQRAGDRQISVIEQHTAFKLNSGFPTTHAISQGIIKTREDFIRAGVDILGR